MRKKIIQIPIYFGDLILIQTNDFHSVEKLFKKNYEDDLNSFEAYTFKAPYKGYTRYVMVFREGAVKNKTIVHEAVHVVNDIFEDRGILLDIYNDENQCYWTGYIFEQCEIFLNPKAK